MVDYTNNFTSRDLWPFALVLIFVGFFYFIKSSGDFNKLALKYGLKYSKRGTKQINSKQRSVFHLIEGTYENRNIEIYALVRKWFLNPVDIFLLALGNKKYSQVGMVVNGKVYNGLTAKEIESFITTGKLEKVDIGNLETFN